MDKIKAVLMIIAATLSIVKDTLLPIIEKIKSLKKKGPTDGSGN